MAAGWEDGYDVDRFVGEVSRDLICTICNCVPKDPRLCQHRDHVFCFAHISRHLRHSQTCPNCRDRLTLDTLKRPTGFIKNYLNNLQIKCDHNDRGCPDVVKLEDLQRHVAQCGFMPVTCSNEGCAMQINKQDKENHEKYLRQFRILTYRDIKLCKEQLKEEIKVQMETIETRQKDTKKSQEEIKGQIEKLKRRQEKFREETKVRKLEQEQKEIKQSVDEMRSHIDRMMIMLNQALRSNQVNISNQDVIIIGGCCYLASQHILNTTEKYNIVTGESISLPKMNIPRSEAASCVYNGDVMIVGGRHGRTYTDTMEILKMDQDPLQWTKFEGKLPYNLSGHDAVCHDGKLYVIGGHNWSECKVSDAIHEVLLTPPYTCKLLTRMPQPRQDHTAVIVNGKLFVFGGTTTLSSNDAIDSVLVYDFASKEMTQIKSLPKAVCVMSSVTWSNCVILIGGVDKNDHILNDVIMYDSAIQKYMNLPQLKHKRRGSSAVIMHDVITVFGGWNREKGYLNSVETLKIGDNQWKELPGMKEKRAWLTCVAKP